MLFIISRYCIAKKNSSVFQQVCLFVCLFLNKEQRETKKATIMNLSIIPLTADLRQVYNYSKFVPCKLSQGKRILVEIVSN